jgi:hypothetical protein
LVGWFISSWEHFTYIYPFIIKNIRKDADEQAATKGLRALCQGGRAQIDTYYIRVSHRIFTEALFRFMKFIKIVEII